MTPMAEIDLLGFHLECPRFAGSQCIHHFCNERRLSGNRMQRKCVYCGVCRSEHSQVPRKTPVERAAELAKAFLRGESQYSISKRTGLAMVTVNRAHKEFRRVLEQVAIKRDRMAWLPEDFAKERVA